MLATSAHCPFAALEVLFVLRLTRYLGHEAIVTPHPGTCEGSTSPISGDSWSVGGDGRHLSGGGESAAGEARELTHYARPMTRILEGTVALVTGASSGIGAATARQLAANGAAVALAARRKDRLEALATEMGEAGGRAVVIQQGQATEAVERAVSELGRLDTLVNNAGVMLLGPAVGAPLSEWQRMVELNVLGLLYCAHAAIPHLLRAAEEGPRQIADMVNISSVAGRVARNGSGVYNLTKHGVGAFSESLRQELATRHVRVSLVEPGATATELASHNRPEVLESLKGQFGRRMEAEDIADAIGYIVTRPRHVAVNEILIRPTEQER
jgi:NADP-dependent 3-hydroxy acid dehydrogenase YdfG